VEPEGSLRFNAHPQIDPQPRGTARGAAWRCRDSGPNTRHRHARVHGRQDIGCFLRTRAAAEVSDEDVERIAKAVIDINNGKIAKAPLQQLFRQLDRDPNIDSVGAITKPNDKPSNPIPRSEFPSRAGIVPAIQATPRSRATQSTERLTLIRPVLLDTDRPWRFESPLGELPYRMDDKAFLKGLLDGKTHLSMKKGIQITAKVETDEELEGGVWIAKLRKIVRVLRVHKKTPADDLFSSSEKVKKRKAKKHQTKKPKRRTPK
jgi:hypothetical protein